MPDDRERCASDPGPDGPDRGALLRALDRLRPGRTRGNPPVFLLEVAAALLTVLTLRDGIIGGGATRLEMFAAVALWIVVLLAAFGAAALRTTERGRLRS